MADGKPEESGETSALSPALDERTLRIIPWIVAISFFMQMLDTSIMNTALPSIARSLRQDPLTMHWAIVSYMLTVAVLMPVSGWLADRLGTRLVLFWAIMLFSAGSLFCALSTSLPMLVAARVVQGAGGGFMVPVGRLTILRIYPRRSLLQVLSFVSIPGMIGPLLGPAMGGFLVQFASWHWIFLINLPVGLLGGLAVLRYIPEIKRSGQGRFDIVGFLFFALSMLLLSFALDSAGQDDGAGSAVLAALAGGGILCLALYALNARRVPNPLFRLSIFRIRSFSVGILGNIFARLASGGMPYLTPLLLQIVMGYSPLAAGAIMIPSAAFAIFSKAMATRLLGRFGYRNVLFVNTVLLGALIASYSVFTPQSPLWLVLAIFCLFGAVNSLQFTCMNTLTLIELPDSEASSGNSLLSVVMQLSLSMGVAVTAAFLKRFLPVDASPGGFSDVTSLAQAFHLTYLYIGVINAVTAVIFLFSPKGLGKVKPQSVRTDAETMSHPHRP